MNIVNKRILINLKGYFWKCMLTSIRNVKFIKMRLFTMFIIAVCVLFLINPILPGGWGGAHRARTDFNEL